MNALIHSIATGLTDLILAPICLGCDGIIRAGDTARLVCRQCLTKLRPLPPPSCARCGAPLLATGRSRQESCSECATWPDCIAFARSACLLHPPADRIVHQLKYRGWKALAAPMANRMTRIDLPGTHDDLVVVPVPTTKLRLRERGYNQAALLAGEYARLSNRRCAAWLDRGSARGSQTTLQPAERAANVAGSFTLTAQAFHEIGGAHVLLIDDVLTTGATAVECGRTLAAAGAASISILTFCRALDARRLLQA